ncbi:exo-alpha-sialidase [Aeoliella sp. ICT_H6.2]|uniref:Exo-alpha-sialidase n=1 Tax=Aeoliella straminimaris TaxID=2954799 RepID=A0A9X2F9G3_9BACT|nr:exo-alpha-sialidase [Aeoliella straminimaris]MCO6044852.1 exo-alpha-sialidase [Aeoliella straminimaris]
MCKTPVCFLAGLLISSSVALANETQQEPVVVTLIGAERIWDQAPHNAFTDLIEWRGQLVCAFREGRQHVSSDGAIRVLTSKDGHDWQSAARLELAGYDLRDASLSVMPDGRLMILGGAAPRKADGESAPTGSFTATATKRDEWSTPEIVVQPGRWLWRVTWRDDTAWGVEYPASVGQPFTSLVTLKGDNHVQTQVERLFGKGHPNEATIRFDSDGTMVCLQRRDGVADDRTAYLGTSLPPYTDWKWRDLGAYVGGPNLIQTEAGHWLTAGRMYVDGKPKTVIGRLDVDEAKLTKLCELPSGGDCSYPGLVFDDNRLLVSYYSSHQGKAAIYLAKLRVEE